MFKAIVNLILAVIDFINLPLVLFFIIVVVTAAIIGLILNICTN